MQSCKNLGKTTIFALTFLSGLSLFGTVFAEDSKNTDISATTTTTPAPSATQVTTFKPSNLPGKVKLGSCFASSTATDRPDAWRCQVDSSIYDPCFTTSVKNRLICDADPTANKPGFPLQIIKQLPQIDNTSATPATSSKPWRLTLEDGSVCAPYTGTMPIIPYEDKMIGLSYGCTTANNVQTQEPGQEQDQKQQSGLIDGSIDISSSVYHALQMIYTVNADGSLQVVRINPVALKTVWQ